MPETETHPVQTANRRALAEDRQGRVSTKVTMAAYEVYSHIYGEQKALITDGCRGGFGMGELIAFLYARGFPHEEWRDRVREAEHGMKNL